MTHWNHPLLFLMGAFFSGSIVYLWHRYHCALCTYVEWPGAPIPWFTKKLP